MKTKQDKPKRNAGHIALISAALIFCVWFALSLFTGEPATVGNLTGIFVFGLLALYGLIMAPVNRFLKRLWKTKGGKIIEILVGLILGVIFTLAFVTFGCMLNASESQAKPGSPVIVLGCKVNDSTPSLTLHYRLEAALHYLQENPNSFCVVSGARGPRETVTEASVMRRWLVERGIPEEKVLSEDEATDTFENLMYAKKMLQAHSVPVQYVVIATSDFHMYRSRYIAKKFGMESGALSAKTPWWLYPTYTVREMYGILESWFLQ